MTTNIKHDWVNGKWMAFLSPQMSYEVYKDFKTPLYYLEFIIISIYD